MMDATVRTNEYEYCTQCGEPVLRSASKCDHCGAFTDSHQHEGTVKGVDREQDTMIVKPRAESYLQNLNLKWVFAVTVGIISVIVAAVMYNYDSGGNNNSNSAVVQGTTSQPTALIPTVICEDRGMVLGAGFFDRGLGFFG